MPDLMVGFYRAFCNCPEIRSPIATTMAASSTYLVQIAATVEGFHTISRRSDSLPRFPPVPVSVSLLLRLQPATPCTSSNCLDTRQKQRAKVLDHALVLCTFKASGAEGGRGD